MTATTLTLTDFLLARIAEDEDAAVAYRDDEDAWGNPYSSGASAAFEGRITAERVLAECEAKRRIVELGQFSDSPESAVDFWLEDGKGRTPPQPLGTIVEVFRILALPYADHPDYRQEWKP